MINFVQVDKKIAVGGEMGFYLLGKDDISYAVVNGKVDIKLAIPNWISERLLPATDFAFNGVACTSLADFQSKASLFDAATGDGGGSSFTGHFLKTGDGASFGEIDISAFWSLLRSQSVDGNDYSEIISQSDGFQIDSQIGNMSTSIVGNAEGIVITQSELVDGSPIKTNEYVLPMLAPRSSTPTRFQIAVIPTQSFDSNAQAVAALGVGKMYKSSSFINGSPMVLVTI